MNRTHVYNLNLTWTGDQGTGTTSYVAYRRDHEISIEGKPIIAMSSDPSFRGDRSRYNPEELLVSSLSSCHMLWYLHLCAEEGVVVTGYQDTATGTMQETADGGGFFTKVDLYPIVTVKEPEMEALAQSLHAKANQLCFIANSCKFPVHHHPTCLIRS